MTRCHLEYTGAMISTEMLVKIMKQGYKIREVGVLHSPRLTGKQTGAKLRVILRAFKELFRFLQEDEGEQSMKPT